MDNKYKGIVVEESLEDNRVLNDIEIVDSKISGEENPAERWHLYAVLASEKDIAKLSKLIKNGYYMHFWKDNHMIVIFKDKRIEFDLTDKTAWQQAVDYGASIGIPKEQLDFPTN